MSALEATVQMSMFLIVMLGFLIAAEVAFVLLDRHCKRFHDFLDRYDLSFDDDDEALYDEDNIFY